MISTNLSPGPKILISSCLLGEKVRYDAKDCLIQHPQLSQWKREGTLISLCPEVAAGLPTPRLPAEKQSDNRVVNQIKVDVTSYYQRAAKMVSHIVKSNNIKIAILKEKSPACGVHLIYDGSFKGQLIKGQGHVCKVLKEMGLEVFNEHEINQAALAYDSINSRHGFT